MKSLTKLSIRDDNKHTRWKWNTTKIKVEIVHSQLTRRFHDAIYTQRVLIASYVRRTGVCFSVCPSNEGRPEFKPNKNVESLTTVMTEILQGYDSAQQVLNKISMVIINNIFQLCIDDGDWWQTSAAARHTHRK